MKRKINTFDELIKYLFYRFNDKIYFSFNELWSIEEDKNINKKLKLKIKRMCRELL